DPQCAPALITQHVVTCGEVGMLRLDDLADAATLHGFAQLKRCNVALPLPHPPAHIGVDREPFILNQELSILHRWHVEFYKFKIVCGRHSLGIGPQVELSLSSRS